MIIHDISWPISTNTTAYKNRKTVEFKPIKSFESDSVRESLITLGSHTGTHIDAPSHFQKNGKTIDQLDLSHVIGKCKVFDMSAITDGITQDHLENLDIQAHDIILFKTSNSANQATDKFTPHFIFLEISGAQYLVQRNVKAVGIDYLGIERGQAGHLTHNLLFKHNIVIIEGLRLGAIKQGSYFLCCLPLAIVGLEAAPARAVLIEGI
jgi:arylformamidase